MFSFGAAQLLIAGYLTAVVAGTPILRAAMMRRKGAAEFVPWPEFWGTWGVDATSKLALVAVLYWGGFWS